MGNLTYTDKLRLEKLLGMSGGYVLNFSDRTFQEFVLDSVGIDLYLPGMDAGGTSKAKRLRHLWKTQPDKVVGRLLIDLCDYYQATQGNLDRALLSECQAIAQRLGAGTRGPNPHSSPTPDQAFNAHSSPPSRPKSTNVPTSLQLEALLAQFDEMAHCSNVQQRGYLIEKLLVQIFELRGIDVVRSFRRNERSEQIDAAFKLEGWHYLVECRWREKLADTRQVDGLRGQVQRSGKQTMGLFLSINGWSLHVPSNLKQNPDKSVLLMDGYDLRVILEGRIGLQELLLAKLIHFNIEGEPFVSAAHILASKN